MGLSSSQEQPPNYDQIRLWEIGSKLLVRRGSGGYFSTGEQAYFKNLERKGEGFTPSVVKNTRTNAKDSLESLLHKNGDADIARKMANIESIGSNPMEAFIGNLKGFFKGKGTVSINEYADTMRKVGNPNAHAMSMQPLLHYLCKKYIDLPGHRYAITELLEQFLQLPGVDPNILDNDGRHILDMFDTNEKILSNDSLVQLLNEYNADWQYSNAWKVIQEQDGNSYLVPRDRFVMPELSRSEPVSLAAKKAIEHYNTIWEII